MVGWCSMGTFNDPWFLSYTISAEIRSISSCQGGSFMEHPVLRIWVLVEMEDPENCPDFGRDQGLRWKNDNFVWGTIWLFNIAMENPL